MSWSCSLCWVIDCCLFRCRNKMAIGASLKKNSNIACSILKQQDVEISIFFVGFGSAPTVSECDTTVVNTN